MSKTIEEQFDQIWKEIHQSYQGICIEPYQIPQEMLELVKCANKAQYIMEIGTARGGTLYAFCKVAPNNATIISLDLPNGPYGGGYDNQHKEIYKTFAHDQQTLHLVQANSHSPETVTIIKTILGSNKLDFLFIDGDHTYDGVKQDFEMYAELVKPGGAIAFHDICWHHPKFACHVDQLWNEIRDHYTIKEFKEQVPKPYLSPLSKTPAEIYGGVGILEWQPLQECAIMLMAHSFDQPYHKQLFKQMIHQIRYEPYRKYLLIDTEVKKYPDIYTYCLNLRDEGFVVWEDCPLPEWEKARYGYDRIKAKAIAICHQDDCWIAGKMAEQMRYIDRAALVTCAYIHQIHPDETTQSMVPQTVIKHPIVDPRYGVVESMPSTWIINKQRVPHIPEPFKEVFGQDCAIASAIGSKYGPIISVDKPLAIYNDHGGNQWYDSNHERFKLAMDCIHNYVKSLPIETIQFYKTETEEITRKLDQLPNVNTMIPIPKFEKPLKIVVVGWFAPDKCSKGLADSWASQGHTVIRIATDDIEPKDPVDKWISVSNNEPLAKHIEYISIADLIRPIDQVDLVFVQQSTQVNFDFKNVYIPCCFYYTEPIPMFPINTNSAVKYFFYAYPTCVDFLDHYFGPELNRMYKKWIPWAVNQNVYTQGSAKRTINLGFKGSMKTIPQAKIDPALNDFYLKRTIMLDCLKEWKENPLTPIFEERTDLKELIQFMQKVNIGINIASWELTNERQFFTLACGCVLLQYAYPQLLDLGFGDKYNCLTFGSFEELKDKIQWAKTHPKELEQIRQHGLKTIQQHTWDCRARQILTEILPTLKSEQARLKLVAKWHQAK